MGTAGLDTKRLEGLLKRPTMEWQETLKLEGARKDDPDKIAMDRDRIPAGLTLYD
jgi:hypothetical protein